MKNYISPKYINKTVESQDVITSSKLPEGVTKEVVDNNQGGKTIFSASSKKLF